MTDSNPYHFKLILGNANTRFSGVTSTMLQVLNVQQQKTSLVVLGKHHMPAHVPVINFLSLARVCRQPIPGGQWRVYHARRNLEMIQALLLKHLFAARIRIVFTSTAQRKKTWLTRFLMNRMDGLLSTCTAAAHYMPSPPDRIIPHGIDTDLYRPASEPSLAGKALKLPTAYCIGMFGRVRPQKGVDLLVEAALDLLPDYPDFSVLIVGEITADQEAFVARLREKIEAAGLSDRIRFTGEIPFDQVPEHFRAMSIVTALSRNEGFGLTVLEAMSSAVPVIATRAGAWPDVIDSGKDGYLIDIDDGKALSAALARLMSDPGLRKQLGSKAHAKISRYYDVRHEAQALLDYYDEIARA